MSKSKLYWICQLSGWSVYVLLNLVFFILQSPFKANEILIYLFWLPLGIGITHGFRYSVVKSNLMKVKIYFQIPLVILGSFINASIFYFTEFLLQKALNIEVEEIGVIDMVANVINYAFVFFFWSLAYFAYHFLMNYTQAEMKTLRWEAAMKEAELNKIKSQLNPHFMFNSMNSIRALIDENPLKAKDAVTQLSNILRNTLMMEKNKLIPFKDEIKIVSDYLNLEKIRYEERLNFTINHNNDVVNFQVPPLLLQTLVENAIKHGISKLPKGGSIEIDSEMKEQFMEIKITNDGKYDESNISDSGFGLKNSIERLKYLFGNNSSIQITNENNKVITRVLIPKQSLM
jgi:sensor histidine kinase YesM